MYIPIPSQRSCARAWVAAASAIADTGEAYNVIIDIERPTEHDYSDHAVISLVDRFLREHQQNPVSTVANTIFPQALYDAYGSPRFYEEYLKAFGALGRKGWGRYFERMIRHQKRDGKEYTRLLQKQRDLAAPYAAAPSAAV